MGWISPTGHNDPGSDWVNEIRAYDTYLNLYASNFQVSSGWEPDFLELTHNALNCDKIRHYSDGADITQVDLDVYYSGAWHDVYQGIFTLKTWEEKSLGGTYLVTKLRVRYYHNATNRASWAVEFGFNEAEPVPAWIPKVIMIN